MTQKSTRAVFGLVLLAVAAAAGLWAASPAVGDQAAPAQQEQTAAKKRPKVLVTTLTKGFRHSSIPLSREILQQMGGPDGTFDVTLDDDSLAHFAPDKLKQFDVVMFCLTTGELPLTDEQKQALVDFVSSGKGFVGVHSATDTFYKWPEFGALIGGYFDGHPWNANDTVTIKVERPDHPVCKPWGHEPFELTEEIYQLKEPYDRAKQDVLMSLDTSRTNMQKKGIKRTDGDFAVAWLKPYGKGRVFYTSLGHNEHVWQDKRFQQHLAAGVAWAAGEGPDAAVKAEKK